MESLRGLLARLATRAPVVLFVDDLQWGDVDSAWMLGELLGPPDPPPLLLIACYRSEDAQRSPCVRTLLASQPPLAGPVVYRRLLVEPLSGEEAYELALAMSGEQSSAGARRAAEISGQAQGDPYLIVESARHSHTAGGPGPWESGQIQLEKMLLGRVDRLPQPARDVLELIAVAGHPLRLEDACRAAGVAADPRPARQLDVERLIRTTRTEHGEEIEPYHDRIREAVINPPLARGRSAICLAALLRQLGRHSLGDRRQPTIKRHVDRLQQEMP